jgi:deoxyribonuclease-4
METNNHQLLLGAHLSISGGLERALYDGQKIGCTAIQIFTHSNRQWHIKPLQAQEIATFKAAQKETGINAVMVHASYLINLASPKADQQAQSLKTVIKELERCEQLGIDYLVLHPGSFVDGTEDAGLHYLVAGIEAALVASPGKTMILLENMAGQGSSLGRRFEQLAFIRDNIQQKKRVGFCLDTCHAFAAGYDLSTPETYNLLFNDIDKTLGLEHLRAIHLNDSKNVCGSHVDRHAHIGEGKMGIEAFRLLMNDPRLVHIPKILETPKDAGLEDDIKNLEVLRGLLE